MKHLRYLLMAALVALPLAACDEDEEKAPVVEPTPVGTITGTVTVAGAGQANVDVTLVGKTSQSVKTGSDGKYTFANVEAGSYGVTISNLPLGSTFPTTSKTTAITQNGQTVTVDFAGSWIQTSSIVGTVTVAGQGINGVSVTLSGTQTGSSVTANGGNFSFTGLRAGSYTVAISNIPAGFTFAVTSYPVTVGVGEAKTVAFVGQPVAPPADPVTASVTIQAVTQFGTNFPVNPNNVQGQIDVVLNVNRGQNRVNRIELLLGDSVVVSQTLTNPPEGEAQPQSEIVVFSVNTAELRNPAAGTVRWPNGNYQLRARLGLVGAQQTSVTTSMQLTFNNPDRIEVQLTAPTGPAFAANGFAWRAGAATVTAIPVLYSGRTVSQMTLQLLAAGSGAAFPPTDDVLAAGTAARTLTAAPWVATWPTTGANNVGSVEGPIYARVSASVYSDGTPGPTTPNYQGAIPEGQPFFVRLDNVAPALAGTVLQPPATNWFGANHVFAQTPAGNALTANFTTGGPPVDAGVGGVTFQWQYSTNPDAATPTWTTFASTTDLPLTTTNTALGFRVRALDALGNAAVISTVPLTRVGADREPPVMTLQTAPANNSTNDFTNFSFLLSDNASGFGATPLQVRILLTRFLADGSTQTRCVTTAGVEAAVPAAGCGWETRASSAFPIPGNQGYQQVELRAQDLALNNGAVQTRLVLRDNVPPTVTIGAVTIDGNTRIVNAVARDLVDLRATDVRMQFAGGVPASGLPLTPLSVFGSYGVTTRIASRDLSHTFALWRGIQESDAPPVLPGLPNSPGTIHAATGVGFGAQDVARNFGTAFYPAAHTLGAPTTFNTGVAPATDVWAFHVSLPSAAQNICNGGTGCGAGVPNVRTLRATVSGAPSVFTNPFSVVYFYRRDAAGDAFLIGTATAAVLEEIDVGGVLVRRDYHYTVDFDATGLPPQVNVPIVAVGYSTTKVAGLVSVANTFLTIQGTLPLPWP